MHLTLLFLSLLSQVYSVVAFDKCCAALSAAVGSNKVFTPNSTVYENSAITYFAQQEGELSPSCYVKPTSSEDVSLAIKALASLNKIALVCPFAVRGGGHHTVIGIANIHGGITIDLGNINQTTVSTDKKIASVGSGARWGSVYSTVVDLGLGVLGGHESDIGVGGFTTGGGISSFGSAYGFGCDMVEIFEVVLANGEIVNANATANSDLFKALKGGSNNFGVVTRFDLKTFELGQYWGGNIFYLGTETLQLLDAFEAFTTNPNFDIKASMIFNTLYTSAEGFVATANLAYTKAIEDPPIFVNFTSGIPSIGTAVGISNLSDFASALGQYQSDNLREASITATVKPVASLLKEIYLLWNATVPAISSADDVVYSLAFQPLPVNMLNAGPLNGGNSLGLDSSEGPLVVLTLTTEYTSSDSDGIIETTTRALFRKIEALASEINALDPWLYLNYADVTQDVIPSYGSSNVQEFRDVSSRVDPSGFFQTVQPGGFKIY